MAKEIDIRRAKELATFLEKYAVSFLFPLQHMLEAAKFLRELSDAYEEGRSQP